MTEDQEPSEDKLSKLKLKLKNMGVMQDENATPEHKGKPFWRGKISILLVVIFAIGFIWWISNNDLSTTDTLAKNEASTSPAVNPMGPGYPPRMQMAPPMPPPPMPPSPPGWAQEPQNNNGNEPFNGYDQRSSWPGHANRYHDRYGPPPGWQPYGAYPPPPPPPPRFYGNPYYGPPPGYYPNPYNRGYNGPPPPR